MVMWLKLSRKADGYNRPVESSAGLMAARTRTHARTHDVQLFSRLRTDLPDTYR